MKLSFSWLELVALTNEIRHAPAPHTTATHPTLVNAAILSEALSRMGALLNNG